jgi:hypothetical protein
MLWVKPEPGAGRVVPLVAAITALLIAGAAVVTARTATGPSTLAFIAGGRAVVGAAPAMATAGTATAPVAASPSGRPTSLDAALAAAGTPVPAGAHVYAARVGRSGAGPVYDEYVAGGGALATDFWPASSIKVLAALGALEYVGTLGYTGAATVTFADTGRTTTIRAIYDGAIRDSSNEDYDRLVEIAGVGWLNREFLTPARGFPATVIQRSYTVGGNLRASPAMSLVEGDRRSTLPARSSPAVNECPAGNCSDLFEMSESVRRVVLHDEIPAAQRFSIARSDATALTASLLGAEGYFNAPVATVLGPGARIYSKPGEVPGRDCMDVTLIESRTGKRFLLSVTVPAERGHCDTLLRLATAVLRILNT